MTKFIAQQGEVRICRISSIPARAQTTPHTDRCDAGIIIGHSESGHHHCLTGGDVMERVNDVPAGMKIFYAILENPEALIQDAPSPHESVQLDPGVFEFRLSREFDPFAEQARRVAD